MWEIANDCCLSTLKKWAGGIRNDLEELALDATILLFNKIKNGTRKEKDWRVESLPTCCYWTCKKVLYSEQLKFNDSLLSFDELDQNRI